MVSAAMRAALARAAAAAATAACAPVPSSPQMRAECPAGLLLCEVALSAAAASRRVHSCGLFNGTECCGDVDRVCPGRCPITGLVLPDNGLLGSCGAVGELQHLGTCEIACAQGYRVRGRQPACVDGALSHSVICEAQPCELAALPHAILREPARTGRPTGLCERFLPHGERCSLQCADGFHFVGERLECMYGQQVAARPGRCVPDRCSGLNPPVNGAMGGCAADGTLADGSSCSLSCEPGFHMIVRTTPHCSAGQLRANVECRAGPQYAEPVWSEVSLGLFCLMVIALVVFVGCSRSKAKAPEEAMQPLQLGYELEEVGGQPGAGQPDASGPGKSVRLASTSVWGDAATPWGARISGTNGGPEPDRP